MAERRAWKEVLVPVPEDMLDKRPVSKRINNARTPGDDPTPIDGVSIAA
ncbi:MAG: hypothetical protein WCE79_23590 [Xanthobacteraceae bacterium]